VFISLFATIITFIVFRSRRNALLDPYTIFFVAWLYYAYYIPVLMILSDFYEVGEMGVFVSEGNLGTLAQLNFWCFLVFTIVYKGLEHALAHRFLPPPERMYPEQERQIIRGQRYGLIAACVGIAILGTIIFPQDVIDLRADYGSKIYTVYSSSTFAALQRFWVSLVGMTFIHSILYSKNPGSVFAIGAVLMCVLAFATYSKTPLIFLFFLGLVFAHRMAGRFQLLVVTAFILAFGLSLVTILPTFAVYRYSGEIKLVDFADMNVQQIFSDARGPLFTNVISLEYANSLNIPSLLHSWILWIPRYLWPDRPLDVAEAFAQAYMPGWQPGFGYGLSPIAEGILRFEPFAAPLIFIFFAATIMILRLIFLTRMDDRLRVPVDLLVFGQILFLMNRGPLSAVTSIALQLWIPTVILFLLMQWVTGAKLLRVIPRRGKIAPRYR
jgi:hypothetical protein